METSWEGMHKRRVDKYNREAQAAAVAERLLGKDAVAVCSNPHHGFGAHPRFTDCEDWQG